MSTETRNNEIINIMIHCTSSNCTYKREDGTCRAPLSIQTKIVLELKVFEDNSLQCKYRLPVKGRIEFNDVEPTFDEFEKFCPACGEEYPESLKMESGLL